MAGVSVGKLGKGVVVRMAGSCVCGATGNCHLRAYAPRKGGYRLVADGGMGWAFGVVDSKAAVPGLVRSEEHTSELQSHLNIVCRLLLEKKKSRSSHHDARLDLHSQ